MPLSKIKVLFFRFFGLDLQSKFAFPRTKSQFPPKKGGGVPQKKKMPWVFFFLFTGYKRRWRPNLPPALHMPREKTTWFQKKLRNSQTRPPHSVGEMTIFLSRQWLFGFPQPLPPPPLNTDTEDHSNYQFIFVFLEKLRL